MSKYTEALKIRNNPTLEDIDNGELSKTIDQALEITDSLEQAESELKDEYNSMNDWYINKFDIFQDHTECEKIALDFTLSTMQTISYLLDSLADIRGDNNGND